METGTSATRRTGRASSLAGRIWTTVAERGARWLFVGPPLFLLVALTAYPTIYLVRLALSRFEIASMAEPQFIGLANFPRLFADAKFIGALGNTLIISVGAVAVEFLVGLALALLLYEPLRGAPLVKPLLIIPLMVPPVVVGLNFRLILDTFGPLNALVQLLGLGGVDWLGSRTLARISIVITDVWQWSPFIFLVLLAALQAIPVHLLDAARVDGASFWSMFRYVLWPMMLPATTVALAFRFVDALKLFDIVYMLTSGGPASSTEVVSLYVYRTAFRFGSLGYASAMAILVIAISSIFVWVLLRLLGVERRLDWR
jgi:multiple sugar transport system permease protein